MNEYVPGMCMYCVSRLLPYHTEIQCPIFQVPNGIVNQTGTKLGDTADVICDSCYEIHGTGQLTCLENGDWDYESPTCQRKD